MTLVSIPLMDRTGRRTLHLYGLGGMFIFSIFITISFLIKASRNYRIFTCYVKELALNYFVRLTYVLQQMIVNIKQSKYSCQFIYTMFETIFNGKYFYKHLTTYKNDKIFIVLCEMCYKF